MIGLTGGIGSGKSTVAAMFVELAVPVLDLDKVGRTLVTTDAGCLQQLTAAFGEKILHADGSLDRRALAAHCFSDAGETDRLNAIMHPLIWRQEKGWMKRQKTEYVIIEASVLLESGGATRMDAVIVVLADESTRLQRVLSRGHQDKAEFQTIMARQCNDVLRLQMADHVIENNGSVQQLRKQVQMLHWDLQQQCKSRGM